MGLISSLTFNVGMARNRRETLRLQDATRVAVSASEITTGDLLPMLEGKAWTVSQVTATGRRLSGLGLIRVGMTRDKMIRIVAVSESGDTDAFELPETYLVLKAI